MKKVLLFFAVMFLIGCSGTTVQLTEAQKAPDTESSFTIVPGILDNLDELVLQAPKAQGLLPFFEPAEKIDARPVEAIFSDWVNKTCHHIDDVPIIEISNPRLFTYCFWPKQDGLPYSITTVAVVYDIEPQSRSVSGEYYPMLWVWFVDNKPLGYHFSGYGPRYDACQHTVETYHLVSQKDRLLLISNGSGWCHSNAYEVNLNPLKPCSEIAYFEAREGNLADFYFAVSPKEPVLWALLGNRPAINYTPELREFARKTKLPIIYARTQIPDDYKGYSSMYDEERTLPLAQITHDLKDAKKGTYTRHVSYSWIETWDLRARKLIDAHPMPHKIIAKISDSGDVLPESNR